MPVKARYKVATDELDVVGVFDETTALGTNQKGKLVNSTGDFIGLGWEEEDDILYNTNGGLLPSNGVFGNAYNRYTQTNIAIESRMLATKDGNQYAYVIKRAPNITNSLTWGGVSLYPPAALMRKSGNKFRFSFDYRGYSGGHPLEVFQNFTIGWGDFGINLPTPWYASIETPFDTDWEWRHYSYEFTVTDAMLNAVAGNYDWNASTQYPSNTYYGIRYNGDLYKHNAGSPVPTLGVDPATEFASGNGVYSNKYVGGAAPGYFNVYSNIKIGFNYEAQNTRGTHLHVDNITLTNITNNDTFKFNLAEGTWVSENISDSGFDILAKGTAYVSIARTDNGADVFAVEGDRVVKINGVNAGVVNSRGLMLTILNSSGEVVSNTSYDVHGDSAAITILTNALSAITASQFWILTSFDAIGSAGFHDSNPALRNKLISMGSRMWDPNSSSLYLWYYNANDVRNTYAAVGQGQTLFKEDGSGASDSTYKRKAVIQTRIS